MRKPEGEHLVSRLESAASLITGGFVVFLIVLMVVLSLQRAGSTTSTGDRVLDVGETAIIADPETGACFKVLTTKWQWGQQQFSYLTVQVDCPVIAVPLVGSKT